MITKRRERKRREGGREEGRQKGEREREPVVYLSTQGAVHAQSLGPEKFQPKQ